MIVKLACSLVLALACLALLAACDSGGGGDGATPTPPPGETASPTVSPVQTATATPPAFVDVCQPNPDPADPDVAAVDSPAPGDMVTSPLTVSGSIAAFEARFNITIFDAAGNAIVEVPGMSAEGQLLSPFSQDVFFSVVEDTSACLWVYDISEADGVTPINVVQVPLTLAPGGQPTACQPNPDPATPDVQVIDQPSPGDIVISPVTISGQVAAFEATFQVGIFAADGAPIVETFGMAAGGEVGELAPFSIDVTFSVDQPTPACIWVYEASAQDGSPIHVGQIPVTLLP